MKEYIDKAVVFTQAYNASATISRAMDSILNQTKGNIDYFVLDNGSSDGTIGIIKEYAVKDERVKPIQVKHNDLTIGGILFNTIMNATNAKWAFWCDADDEYELDFFEKMSEFSEENNLDIASCGYIMADSQTGGVIKRRALDESLVVSGDGFSDSFIKYRGFTTFMWGKLYTVPSIIKSLSSISQSDYELCMDSAWLLSLWKLADRAGVYPAAMYKYYQYPHSLSRMHVEKSIVSLSDFWMKTKEYIEHYGPISKVNEDFLYAIHLSLVEEAVEKILTAELTTEAKVELLAQIFADPKWEKTMTRDADPQFLNLASRREFVESMKNKVYSMPCSEQCMATAHVISLLELW